MYLIKIMSSQNLPDSDMAKNYRMIAIGACDQFEFYHCQETGLPFVNIIPKGGDSFQVELTGNAYVVSETGKTVSTHWARSMWGREETDVIQTATDSVVKAVKEYTDRTINGADFPGAVATTLHDLSSDFHVNAERYVPGHPNVN